MKLEITRLEGLRNDLGLRLERTEVEAVRLSIANRRRLMELPGMLRHRAGTDAEARGVAEAKRPIEEHLQSLGLTGADGRPIRRGIAISNRNLGANHGHVAWQRGETPRLFHVVGDPCDYGVYSCFTVWRTGGVSIEDLRFDFAAARIYAAADGRELTDDIEWATFGQRLIRASQLTRIEDILHQFYDVRHALAFDHTHAEGEAIRRGIYEGYPATFRANVLRAWGAEGVPRARYFHSAIGCSSDAIFIVQREGTIEEVGAALRAAGAEDGVLLENGGSVACWVWWANNYAGGLVSPTVDYRPPGTSAIGFILKGPTAVALPGGSVSYSTY